MITEEKEGTLTISVDDSEKLNIQKALVNLCQAVTHSPNFGAYNDDVFWAMELLNKTMPLSKSKQE